jgi:hypothetical protein
MAHTILFTYCSFFICWRAPQDTALAAAEFIYFAYAPRLRNSTLDGIQEVR